jgi:hypothetical protein
MKLAIGLALPLLLIIAGVLLLIGCFPVPATQQLQPNLKPRPELGIGAEADKFIRPGITHIDDAFIELNRRIYTVGWGYPEQFGSAPWRELAYFVNRSPSVMLDHWTVSPDRREFTVRYGIRTATWVLPLCFQLNAETESKALVLEVNADGVVTGTRTLDDPPLQSMRRGRWFEVFDAPTRQKLHEAGVFPSDAALRTLAGFDAPRPPTYPSTQREE